MHYIRSYINNFNAQGKIKKNYILVNKLKQMFWFESKMKVNIINISLVFKRIFLIKLSILLYSLKDKNSMKVKNINKFQPPFQHN